jgi:hypothetical protein
MLFLLINGEVIIILLGKILKKEEARLAENIKNKLAIG